LILFNGLGGQITTNNGNVREIKKHSYSTIVMGRRLAKDKNIFKGVTDRVLANVHDVALWVVG
jgi:hypothetical protein